ncbi:MAG: hypothetical protein V4475_16265 [Pseudomonadota bacterium]
MEIPAPTFMKFVPRSAALIALLLSTGGCVSMRPTMTSFSVDYNRVVADTRNQMILLNIVRSAYREPTYYTAFSQIEGSLSLEASVSGEVANLLGGDATAFTPTVSGSITNAPTFTIVPLNSDEFSKGMLAPIGADTVRLFLSQGWRSALLAPLIVQKVECVYDGEVVAEIENQPGAMPEGITASDFSHITFRTAKPEASTPYPLTVESSQALKAITGGALDKFDIALGPQPADPLLARLTVSAPSERALEVDPLPRFASACSSLVKGPLDRLQSRARMLGQPAPAFTAQSFSEKITAGGARSRAPGVTSMNIQFRSTDGIVYYLGQLLRAKLNHSDVAPTYERDAIFDVARNAPGEAAVAVTHRGARWSIAARDITPGGQSERGDRSLEVMALLNQLISAQTSLKEFTRAPTSVRVR